jgi:hypothetical protein
VMEVTGALRQPSSRAPFSLRVKLALHRRILFLRSARGAELGTCFSALPPRAAAANLAWLLSRRLLIA